MPSLVARAGLAALTSVLAACGPSQPPLRSSPELTAAAATPFGRSVLAYDGRRAGVFSSHDSSPDGHVVLRERDGALIELFRAPLYGLGSVHLASSADDDAVLSVEYDYGSALLRWDGATLHDLGERLDAVMFAQGPEVLDRPSGEVPRAYVSALDLAADGSIVVGMRFTSNRDDPVLGQLCRIGATPADDACELVAPIAGDDEATVRAVVALATETLAVMGAEHTEYLDDGRLRTVLTGGLYRRPAAGAWALVHEGNVSELFAIDAERVAYVGADASETVSLRVLRAGSEESRTVIEDAPVHGRSADGLWQVIRHDGEGSCPSSWSGGSCTGSPVWTQLVVMHIGAEPREVGHVNLIPGGWHEDSSIFPLASGSLRIEADDRVYELAR